ncbi:MAG: adenine phosphoribosyltransferase [Ileibacterium sp.]|nr:adenine phosphoribosyltransferase [Ileibacterium sp.]
MNYEDYIATIPDFPKKGIMFRDVTPILENADVMNSIAQDMAAFARLNRADVIAAPEARGFLFGLPAAMAAGLPFIPVRKPGKLPRETVSVEYDLEYGTDTLEMHKDAIKPGQKVLIIDDLLATGGTVAAIEKMLEKMGAECAGFAFVVELDDLHGREKLTNAPVLTLAHYKGE